MIQMTRRQALAGAAALLAGLAAGSAAAAGGYRTISAEEAKARMEAGGVTILDVRTPAEFSQGHIKGAVNVPVDRLAPGRRLAVSPNPEKPVLIYCRSGRRAETAGRMLAEAGYREVLNFGGINNWPYELIR